MQDLNGKLKTSSGGISHGGETFERGSLVGKFRKDLIQLRHSQDGFDLWRESDHFHRAAFFYDAHIISHQFADAGTVEVFQSGQIQNDIGVPLLQQPTDHLLEGPGFEGSELAIYIDEGDAI
jgi:hypothetical protein